MGVVVGSILFAGIQLLSVEQLVLDPSSNLIERKCEVVVIHAQESA